MALGSVGAEGALVVGDTVWDIEAAAKAGVPCVELLSGGWARPISGPPGAVAVFGTPRDLLENLDKALESAGHGTGR